MTPAELYNSIKQQMTMADTSICQLHKPCTATPACVQPQNHPMLDFDEVEKRWHQQKGMKSTASVDALSHTERTLCMIEIKGWKMFLKHQPIAQQSASTPQQVNQLTQKIEKQTNSYQLQDKLLKSIEVCEEMSQNNNLPLYMPVAYIQVNQLTQKIEKQTNSYQLQDKLLKSIEVCEEMSQNNNLPLYMPVAYILVTDIDPTINAAAVFTQQLNMLASTSSNWETVCAQHLSKRFQQQTAGMNNIRSYFIYCKQLDNLLAKL